MTPNNQGEEVRVLPGATALLKTQSIAITAQRRSTEFEKLLKTSESLGYRRDSAHYENDTH